MPSIDDAIRSPVLEHLRETERMLRLIEQLAHGPNSCDHRLVQTYALYALARVQAAERVLKAATSNSATPEDGG